MTNSFFSKAISHLFEIAQEWRTMNGYTGKGGVVVLYGDQVQGWVSSLRTPEHWKPGVIAVAEDGSCFRSIGGDDQDGAEKWEPCRFTGE